MTPLRAQIVAARAYEAAWSARAHELMERATKNPIDPLVTSAVQATGEALTHRRAAEIMEAEIAKEEEGEG